MKKLIIAFTFLFTFIGIQNVNAQKVAVGGEIGFSLFAAKGTNFAFPLGLSTEIDVNGKLSVQASFAFDIGLGAGDFSLFYVSPEVRYNFSEVFDGAYVGGYLGFGPAFGKAASFNSFYFTIGAVGGYEIMLTENLNLDISAQFGFGRVGSTFGNSAGLHFRPTAGLRYAF